MNASRTGESKTELRQRLKRQRDSIPADIRAVRSADAVKRIAAWPLYRDARTVMAYLSCNSELETDGLIRMIIADRKTAALPVVNPALAGYMSAAAVTCIVADIAAGSFGIREPKGTCASVHPGDIDLVIVPGIAFDTRGHRLGYGRGYYDRWLEMVPLGRRWGLCFEEQLIERLPNGIHDLPVAGIITETRLIRAADDTAAVYNRQKRSSQ